MTNGANLKLWVELAAKLVQTLMVLGSIAKNLARRLVAQALKTKIGQNGVWKIAGVMFNWTESIVHLDV